MQDQYAKATKKLDNVRLAELLLAQVYRGVALASLAVTGYPVTGSPSCSIRSKATMAY